MLRSKHSEGCKNCADMSFEFRHKLPAHGHNDCCNVATLLLVLSYGMVIVRSWLEDADWLCVGASSIDAIVMKIT